MNGFVQKLLNLVFVLSLYIYCIIWYKLKAAVIGFLKSLKSPKITRKTKTDRFLATEYISCTNGFQTYPYWTFVFVKTQGTVS